MADTNPYLQNKTLPTQTVLDYQQSKPNTLSKEYRKRNDILGNGADLTKNVEVQNTLTRMNANKTTISNLTAQRDQIIKNKNEKYDRFVLLSAKYNKDPSSMKPEEIKEMNTLRTQITNYNEQIQQMNQAINYYNQENSQMQNVLEKNLGTKLETDKDGKISLQLNPETGKPYINNKVGQDVLIILEKLENGLTPLQDDEIRKLLDYQNADGLYDKAKANFMKNYTQGYKYNIRNNLNEKLFDIRNYRNFRSLFANSNNSLANQNFTKTVMGGGTCASRSFYMSKKDFFWSQNYLKNYTYDGSKLLQDPVQNIILNEYQPVFGYNLAKTLLKQAGGLLDGAGVIAKLGDLGKEAVGTTINIAINHMVDTYSKNPAELYNQENYQSGVVPLNPMYYVRHLFSSGKWLNTYELPFIQGETQIKQYLQNGKENGNWDIGGLMEQSASQITDDLKNIMQEQGIAMSMPSTPHFQLSTPQKATRSGITLKFYLINVDDQYLDKNFQFMHALFAGTQWLQMTAGFIVGSNVYHIEVPGRFQIHWATVKSTFNCEGRLRTNHFMYTKYNASVTNDSMVPKINSITEDTLWPDAWEVTLEITPLSIHNFNTYVDYFANGFGPSQRTALANAKGSAISGRAPFTTPDPEQIKNQEIPGVITKEMTGQWKMDLKKAIDAKDWKKVEKITEQMRAKQYEIETAINLKYDRAYQEYQMKLKASGKDPLSSEYINAVSAYKKALDEQKNNQLANLNKEGNNYAATTTLLLQGEYNLYKNSADGTKHDFWSYKKLSQKDRKVQLQKARQQKQRKEEEQKRRQMEMYRTYQSYPIM